MENGITKVLETNDVNQIFNLGLQYYYGDNMEKRDYDTALVLFSKAFLLGEKRAKIFMGKCYYYAEGVNKEYRKSYTIFNELVDETNDSEAKFYLGKMYYHGKYVEQDYEKAYSIFAELVEQYDDKYAKYYIGVMNLYGNFVEQNYEKAYNIFSELVEQYDDKYAKYYMGVMNYDGLYIKQNYEKAYNIFSELVEKYNDIEATYYLAEMNYNGKFVEKNEEKGMELFLQTAELDCRNSLIWLANYYRHGKGNDLKKAEEYYDKLVLIYNDFNAKLELAKMAYESKNYSDAFWQFESLISYYEDKDGMLSYYLAETYRALEDLDNAIKWYEKSAELGYELSNILIAEVLIEKNEYSNAIELYKKCTNSEDEFIKVHAQYALGMIHYYGEDENFIDKELGIKYLKEAEQYSDQAKKALEKIKNYTHFK